jgi:hypothetical protein
MTAPDVDNIAEIARLLDDVRPSPAFAARVRAGVESDERKRAAGFSWRNAILAGTAVGVCAAVAFSLTRRHVVPGPTPQATAVRPATSVVERPADIAEVRREVTGQVRRPARASEVAIQVEAEPPLVAHLGDHDVIVPVDQRNALARLLSGVRAGGVLGRATLAPAYDKDGLLLSPPPVVVAPLAALAPDDPDDDGGARTVAPRDDRIRKDKR